MKNLSIRVKISLAILLCMLLAVGAIVAIHHTSLKRIIDISTQESITHAQKTFAHLYRADTRVMTSTLTALLNNQSIKNTFLADQRNKLYDQNLPLFEKLKNNIGITHWYFIYPETSSKDKAKRCMLRIHNTTKYNDLITRFTYDNAVKSKSFSSGIELGKTAFALRVVAPYYLDNKLIGYMELGEEIDHFLELMKEQTSSDFGLIIDKQYLNQEKWASVRQSKHLSDNWNDHANHLLINATSSDVELLNLSLPITNIPKEGIALRTIKKSGKIFVRGVFPIYDAGKRKVGGITVLSDITSLYQKMINLHLIIIILLVIISMLALITILFLIDRLVLRRLTNIMNVIKTCTSKSIGGDFDAKIVVKSNDEMSEFERYFEELRQLIVNMIKKRM